MHKYLEDYIEFGEWPTAGSNPYAKQAHMMATKIKVHAMDDIDEIWGSEVPLYVPNIYAGTTDLVGVYKGNPCIMDFKQTNKPKKLEWVEDYFLQLTAYAIAHNEVHGTNIREGHAKNIAEQEKRDADQESALLKKKNKKVEESIATAQNVQEQV